jgi:hypothetical protein
MDLPPSSAPPPPPAGTAGVSKVSIQVLCFRLFFFAIDFHLRIAYLVS